MVSLEVMTRQPARSAAGSGDYRQCDDARESVRGSVAWKKHIPSMSGHSGCMTFVLRDRWSTGDRRGTRLKTTTRRRQRHGY